MKRLYLSNVQFISITTFPGETQGAVLSDKEQHVHLADHLQGRHSQADRLNVDLMCGLSFRYVYFVQKKFFKNMIKVCKKWVEMKKKYKKNI